MLVVAATAAGEVWTKRLPPLRRSFDKLIHRSPRKPRFLFGQPGVNALSAKDEGDKHSFAASMLIRRKAGEAVSAVNLFLNRKIQENILCHGASALGKLSLYRSGAVRPGPTTTTECPLKYYLSGQLNRLTRLQANSQVNLFFARHVVVPVHERTLRIVAPGPDVQLEE